jgi:hypothetical protein
MKKILLAASALVVAALLSSPAGADVDHVKYGHREGEFCDFCGKVQCNDTRNEIWVCKAATTTTCKWHTTGVCTNNLKPGEDINKNAEKEKQNAAERKAANERRAAEEKRAEEKKAADDKKKAEEKKKADDKKAKDAKK